MPRTARASIGGICYHVVNRGNAQATVFATEGDYAAFEALLGAAGARLPMRLVGYCLMPSHFHLVLWPHADGDLSRWMQWLMTAHVRRYHRVHGSSGHVWQGRFNAFPIQQDEHLLTVLRFVERNPLRAGLVRRAEDWRWSSLSPLHAAAGENGPMLDPGPVERPRDWAKRVNRAETEAELDALQRSLRRGTPFGSESWVVRTAARLGLEATTRPRGRPKQDGKA